jgi:two-component system, cell cycle sensor histidine kinase and response regulator CckA
MRREGSTDDEATQELFRLRERVRVISDVTRRFAEATPDYQRLLESVACCLAETLSDACILFLLDEKGEALVPKTMHAVDPAVLEQYRESFAERNLDLKEHAVLKALVSSGKSLLVPKLADVGETSDEGRRWEQAIGLHSVIIVPMQVQSRALGALTLSRYRRASPPFEQQELELAQNLADHAALAIENARLYQAAHQARQAAELARESLRCSEEAQRQFFESSPTPSYVIDVATSRILSANAAALSLYGYSREEFLQLTLSELRFPEDQEALSRALEAAGERDIRASARHRRRDGSQIDIEGGSHLASFEGRPARFVMVSDQTKRIKAELQLRQSQKMEAVGRLAGGIAHDFNNVLLVVLGLSEEILSEPETSAQTREGVLEIRAAAERAAQLTRQLLMFSRQQVLEPRVLDLNRVLLDIQRMLGRVLGEHLRLVIKPGQGLGNILADSSNIEQVLMNLAVNARDAMPGGGHLTIETANVVLDDEFARDHLDAKPGEYVLLSVTDTGSGMDQRTSARIFEPFFTTKELGKGTGLGLSTVLGIVQQSGGCIYVYSELGLGTSFKVYLPRVHAESVIQRTAPPTAALRGSETVLLVEDDPGVRDVARRILERFGYAVLTASTPAEAVAQCEAHSGALRLLLTDVVMPGENGVKLANQLTRLLPRLKVLFMSGYTDGSIGAHGLQEGGGAFLQKPFSAETLARKVRAVLDDAEG